MTVKARPAESRAGLLGAAGSVAWWTLISRILGFLRWLIQAATVGAGTVAGAYATANQVPNVLYEVVVGGALSATIVPLLATPIAAKNQDDAARIARGLLGLVLALLIPLALILALAAGPIAAAFPASAGVDPALQHRLVADFLRMFALQIPLYGVGVVFTGVLQAHGRFTWPALAPIASSLMVMATYACYGYMSGGAHGAAIPSHAALAVLGWGTTLGVAALSLPLAWPVSRLGVRIMPSFRLPRAELGRALRLGGAGVWTLITQQISVLAVLALARRGGETGTVAVYQYTQAVYVLPYAVLAVPVATVVYPKLARAFGEGPSACATSDSSASRVGAKAAKGDACTPQGYGADPAGASATAVRLSALASALVLAVAIAGAGALIAASDAAQRVFAHLAHVEGMSDALLLLAPGLIGYALIYHLTRVLFAADHARSAAVACGMGWLGVAVFSVIAVHVASPHGGDGPATLRALAAGLTAGMTLAALGLAWALARHLGLAVLLPMLRVALPALPLSAAGGFLVWWASRTIAEAAGTPASIAVSLLGAALVVLLVLAVSLGLNRDILGVLRSSRGSHVIPDRANEES